MKTLTKKNIKPYFFIAFFIAILPHGLAILNMRLSPSGNQMGILPFLFYMINGVLIFSTPLVIFLGGLFWGRKWEDKYVQNLPIYLTFVITFFTLWPLGNVVEENVRQNGFTEVITQLQPIIQALQEYETANGHLPDDLNELVPSYLPVVPDKIFDLNLRYQYDVSGEIEPPHQNPWSLRVTAPVDRFDYVHFLFLPEQDYKPHFIKIGGWGLFVG